MRLTSMTGLAIPPPAGSAAAGGENHAPWTFTFMAGGNKRVEHIPADWMKVVRPQVEAARRPARPVLANVPSRCLWRERGAVGATAPLRPSLRSAHAPITVAGSAGASAGLCRRCWA
jgi:hypothetical protein